MELTSLTARPQPARRNTEMSEEPSLLAAKQITERIENAIRWHYYDCRCGEQSADPGSNGIDSDIFHGLFECLADPSRHMELKAEGLAWAEKDCGEVEPRDWCDVEKLLDESA